MDLLVHVILGYDSYCDENLLIDSIVSDQIICRFITCGHIVDFIKVQSFIFFKSVTWFNFKTAVTELVDKIFTYVSKRNHIV